VPGAPRWPGAPGAPFWPGSPFGPWRPCGPWAPWSSVPLAKSPRCSEPSLTLAELTAFRLDLRCGDRALFQLFRPDAVGGQSDRCVGRTAERDEHAERCHHVRVAEVSSDAIRMHGVRLTHPEKPYKGRQRGILGGRGRRRTWSWSGACTRRCRDWATQILPTKRHSSIACSATSSTRTWCFACPPNIPRVTGFSGGGKA
jgi:hypothetical protein